MFHTDRIRHSAVPFIFLASCLGLVAHVSFALAAPGLSHAWVGAYDGGGEVDEGKAMVVDGSGNVYVTGGSTYSANARAILTKKIF